MPNLVKKFQNTIFEHNLFPRGSKIIVACSGGPDSTALLDIFSKLQEKYALEIAVTHVNYNLRRKDSNQDEKFVIALAKKYGYKIFVLKPAVKSKRNLENSLRDIRYAFFERIRKQNNFDYIAVAHTLDDQVETYLMRIIRGSGLSGLSSMAYKNETILRPLLNVPKTEIIAYLKKSRFGYRTDKTNLESIFFRNKIRNKLIPLLEKEFNPNIKKTIFDAAESIRDDYDFLNNISEKEFRKNRQMSVNKILALHPSIQKQLLKIAISKIKKGLTDIESSHIREIIKIIKSTKNKSQVVVFKGLKITRRGDKLIISLIKRDL
jgi:tRNA(Ile)-lysidine synthase